jgi:hypothetical protein
LATGCRDRIQPVAPARTITCRTESYVNTRTIAILALVIAVVLLIIFLV